MTRTVYPEFKPEMIIPPGVEEFLKPLMPPGARLETIQWTQSGGFVIHYRIHGAHEARVAMRWCRRRGGRISAERRTSYLSVRSGHPTDHRVTGYDEVLGVLPDKGPHRRTIIE